MDICAVNSTHDSSCVLVSDGELKLCVETEKDSRPRHAQLSAFDQFNFLSNLTAPPDVIAYSAWHGAPPGYFGSGPQRRSEFLLFGKPVQLLGTTHERAHILSSFSLSDLAAGTPFYALTWEGSIGSFYEVDAKFNISTLGTPLVHPGWRYSYAYYLFDPNSHAEGFWEKPAMAGKLMALAGWKNPLPLENHERQLIEHLLSPAVPYLAKPQPSAPVAKGILEILPSNKRSLPVASNPADTGLDSERSRNFFRHYSDAIFDRFFTFAKERLTKRLPLVIGGGCGLNCEWNTRWMESGLFDGVFVPPCTNDSGVAIGAAADAQLQLTGNPKLRWNVYAGEEFVEDVQPFDWTRKPLAPDDIAASLHRGEVVAWVNGRYEIGPRALGNRSLLAAPFSREMTGRLNLLKQRESYRPIAPVCLEEDFDQHFAGPQPSPYMLQFHRVHDQRLQAVTHDDGSARVQTVNREQNPKLYELLLAFKKLSGAGVLCNTSLNFLGKGFINRNSDLFAYASQSGIRTAVVNDYAFSRQKAFGG
jgi:predicted NodU family carbamoyl transferase